MSLVRGSRPALNSTAFYTALDFSGFRAYRVLGFLGFKVYRVLGVVCCHGSGTQALTGVHCQEVVIEELKTPGQLDNLPILPEKILNLEP